MFIDFVVFGEKFVGIRRNFFSTAPSKTSNGQTWSNHDGQTKLDNLSCFLAIIILKATPWSPTVQSVLPPYHHHGALHPAVIPTTTSAGIRLSLSAVVRRGTARYVRRK